MKRFWTEEHEKLCDLAKDFKELLQIALNFLKTLKNEEKFIVEICGPMSTGGLGSLTENLRFYNFSVGILESKDMLVFNPTPFQKAMDRLSSHLKNGEYCMDILEVFYKGIFSSGHISKAYFLPNWQSSKGATWERETLKKHKIEIVDFPPKWLEEFE